MLLRTRAGEGTRDDLILDVDFDVFQIGERGVRSNFAIIEGIVRNDRRENRRMGIKIIKCVMLG
jgi:hypothetical protein